MNIDDIKNIKLKSICYGQELADIFKIANGKGIKVEDYIGSLIVNDILKIENQKYIK